MAGGLESLQDAESRARQELENARREAQKIRLGIGTQIEELESRAARSLTRSRESAREKVAEEISKLDRELSDSVAIKLAELDSRSGEIRDRASQILREMIMSGGTDS